MNTCEIQQQLLYSRVSRIFTGMHKLICCPGLAPMHSPLKHAAAIDVKK